MNLYCITYLKLLIIKEELLYAMMMSLKRLESMYDVMNMVIENVNTLIKKM